MANLLPEVINISATSRAGYNFYPRSRVWEISRDCVIHLSWIDDFLHPNLHDSYLNLLKYYVEKYSAGHANNLSDRFREFSRFSYSNRGLVDNITANDLINYRSTLAKEQEWYLGTIRVFIKAWIELGYSGVDGDVSSLLKGWRLSGNKKGRAVQTLCPKEGPLSDLEFEALHLSLVDAFESEDVTLEEFVLVQLFLATGRRPAQIGDLKAKDIIDASSENGLKEFIVNVPRGKQRGSSWRDQFTPFALVPEIGVALKALNDSNLFKFSALSGGSCQYFVHELPVFPNWKKIKETLGSVTKPDELRLILKSQEFHRATSTLSKQLDKVVSILEVHSERTGTNLKVFPTRLRRTLATRAAREGYGVLVIAGLLDHTDTQNALVYTENVPEHVDAINEAVARQLAPLAQAFAGMLVTKESDAVRGDDLSSRVRSDLGNVGTCGHHGFCGAFSPIACYTCRQFQPWLDAPHQEVLDSLISERDRILAITRDSTIASTNDRTIFAVTQVVQLCAARKIQMSEEISHG